MFNFKKIFIASASLTIAMSTYGQGNIKEKIRIAHFLPATFAGADIDKWFADELKRRSGGSIDTEVFWAGSMGSAEEIMRLVHSGAIEMAAYPASYFGKQYPLTGVASLPNAFDSVNDAYNRFPKMLELSSIQAEHTRNGVSMLFAHISPPYRIACGKTTATLDAMKGYKVRSTGEYVPQVFKAVGFVPVTTPANEVYESLDRKVLDCTMLSYDQMVASKIYEVAKYTNDINLGAPVSWQLWVNKKKFDSMSTETRDLIRQVAKDAMALDVKKANEADMTALEKLQGHGVEFQKLEPSDAFKKAAPSSTKIWETNMKKIGLGVAAEEILEVLKKQ